MSTAPNQVRPRRLVGTEVTAGIVVPVARASSHRRKDQASIVTRRLEDQLVTHELVLGVRLGCREVLACSTAVSTLNRSPKSPRLVDIEVAVVGLQPVVDALEGLPANEEPSHSTKAV